MYHEPYIWAVVTVAIGTTVARCVLLFPVVNKNNVGTCRGFDGLKIDSFVNITYVVQGQQKLVKKALN
jgi:hypothetical protein